MTIFQTILLGFIQGATEFIPISSSGHLVLTAHYLGWEIPAQDAFIFDVLLQVATLVAVFAYFRSELITILRATIVGVYQKKPFFDPNAKLGWYLMLSAIPAGIVGLFANDLIRETFNNPKATSIFLILTAALLMIAEITGNRDRMTSETTWTWKDALWMGIFQILALFPGISRSGATITGGMTRNLSREAAARFSFLMSVPIMIAAGLFALAELIQVPNFITLLPNYLAGFIVASVVGFFSIKWLLQFLHNRPLYVFSFYCAAIGAFTLLINIR
jgi:undecaprenyl-diphosphatase